MMDPAVLAKQLESDKAVIAALAKAASDMGQPHLLEHHFNCDSPEAAQPVLDWARANGYSVSEVLTDEMDGESYTYFDVTGSTVPRIDLITAQTTAMLEAADRFDVIYDGWGCEVVAGNPKYS